MVPYMSLLCSLLVCCPPHDGYRPDRIPPPRLNGAFAMHDSMIGFIVRSARTRQRLSIWLSVRSSIWLCPAHLVPV